MTQLSGRKACIGITMLWLAFDAFGAETATTNTNNANNERRCIPIANIRNTEVIDDQTIAFYMRNGDVYNNHLPHRCSGLDIDKAFSYQTSQSQLCNVDIISVLNHSGGGLNAGASCGIGMFTPGEKKEKSTSN